MRLFFTKLLIAYAFSFILAHNLVPHHHHDLVEISQHQHNDDNDEPNIFYFGSLDDTFINTQNHFSLYSFSVSQYLLLTDIFITSELNFTNCKIDFAFKDESPPPDNHFSSTSRRGPPTA